MTNTDLRKRPLAPIDDGSEHGVDPSLEVGGPTASRLGGRVEASLEVEDRVETRVPGGL